MDDNFNNDPQNNEKNFTVLKGNGDINENDNNIKNYTMDDVGKIRNQNGSAAATMGNTRTLIILGWVSAAFAAFIYPLFAIAGIVFGVMASRRSKGSGTAVIITNVVVAAINLLFGLFLVSLMRRMMFGF